MRFSLFLQRLVVPSAVALCSGVTAAAQSSIDSLRRGWYEGGTIGIPGVEGEVAAEAFTLGLAFTYIAPSLSLDMAVGTAPRAFTNNSAPLGVRAGIGPTIPLSPGYTLLPSVGASWLTDLSTHDHEMLFGWHGGGSVIAAASPDVAVRGGVTFHRFHRAAPVIWLAELGVMIAPGR